MHDDHDPDAAPRLIAFDHERPLDSLIPELAESRAPLPQEPLHPRVLELDLGQEAGWEWLLCAWADPGGARAFHQALQPLVEATLLASLSRPPATGADALERRFRALRLIVFAPVEGIGAAVRAFGLRPEPAVTAATAQADPTTLLSGRLAALAEEARQLGIAAPGRPASIWVAPIAQTDADAHGRTLDAIQRTMAEQMGDDVWGATPGGPSRLAASLLEREFGQRIEPTLAGLDAFERLVVGRATGVVRWIPPLLYQALCDFVGVVAHAEFGASLAWAVCEADVHGLHPPPHLRWEPWGPSGAPVFVPVGLHVLRWYVMPLEPGEEVPPLSAWLADQFGSPPTT